MLIQENFREYLDGLLHRGYSVRHDERGSDPDLIEPVRRWKLSPMEIGSSDRWDACTDAREAMMLATDTNHAPWTSIKSNDKKRARLAAMRVFLNQYDYQNKEPAVVYPPDPRLVQRGRDQIKD